MRTQNTSNVKYRNQYLICIYLRNIIKNKMIQVQVCGWLELILVLRVPGRNQPWNNFIFPSHVRLTQTLTLTHVGIILTYQSLKHTHSRGVGGNQSTQKHPSRYGENMQIPHEQWRQLGVNYFFSSMLLQNAVEQNNSIQEPAIL